MNSTASLCISILVFVLIMRGQLRGMQKPIQKSGLSLLRPILYIATALLQLLDPSLLIQGNQVLIALFIGAIVALPLIFTTNFDVRGDGATYIKRNKLVFIILIMIFALRFVATESIQTLNPSTLAFMINLVTLGYVFIWRSVSFMKFRIAVK